MITHHRRGWSILRVGEYGTYRRPGSGPRRNYLLVGSRSGGGRPPADTDGVPGFLSVGQGGVQKGRRLVGEGPIEPGVGDGGLPSGALVVFQ